MEKTLEEEIRSAHEGTCRREHPSSGINRNSHQKTSLPAGTIANDDQFAANFSHGENSRYTRQREMFLRYERYVGQSRMDGGGFEGWNC